MLPEPTADHIDQLVKDWETTKPGHDFSGMELATRLWRTATLLLKQSMEIISNAGLNQGEFDVLATLYRNGGSLSPTELYQRLLITSGAMTNRLDTLSQKGLVQRTPHPEDKRSLEVHITTEGRLLFDPIFEIYLEQLKSSLAIIPAEQRQALNQGMRQLLLSLESKPS
ncbi:DNA-binding transcriptional regulator, MarR family [Methylobacillus rhizosphaerae]|uniref:DNA-binding transcriptional regulator, MarR family n=1 Tax=Methylobacillus rhizosphaerae TaxID=551994 RepID=A0A239AFV9_9PROT|nr:MarR family transcriptional regulator [Methylobacillus rhizosphaerae]SNR93813.1 DNA-binding transcriptional regulator, MarR family [Methylobacillus rhizosphaerae]